MEKVLVSIDHCKESCLTVREKIAFFQTILLFVLACVRIPKEINPFLYKSHL